MESVGRSVKEMEVVMAAPARRRPAARFPDLLDWLDSPLPGFLPFGSAQTFRVEDYADDGKYIVRAELPGLDPETDVEVTVNSGTLTIRAERREEDKEPRRSEFRYGLLTRSVSLPAGADQGKISAKYDKGILEVVIPVQEEEKQGTRRIAVKTVMPR
jgi:HSP20 family protein